MSAPTEPIVLSLDDGTVDVYAGDDDQVVLSFGAGGEDVWLTPDEAATLHERLGRVLDEVPG